MFTPLLNISVGFGRKMEGVGEGGILLEPKLSQEVNTKPWIDISRFNFTPGTSWLLISTLCSGAWNYCTKM